MINDDLDNTTKMKLLEKCERIFYYLGVRKTSKQEINIKNIKNPEMKCLIYENFCTITTP